MHAGGGVVISLRKKSDKSFVVGTVKGLSDKYGISHIIEAVAILYDTDIKNIQLRIAGSGPQEKQYHELADKLGISCITKWLGFVPQEKVANEWANMDVAIVCSTLESESFGVSAVEAEACATPIIISDIPGLMEATLPGKSSMVVERSNTEQIVRAIRKLYFNENLRETMGRVGRQYVMQKYEMDNCFRRIEDLFHSFKSKYG